MRLNFDGFTGFVKINAGRFLPFGQSGFHSEARLPLADAVILVATSPKSNSAYDAINAAIADVQAGRTGPIPRQLQNKHFDGEDAAVKGQNYKYAHDFENHWVEQQYLPDVLKDVKYYTFGDNRTEQAARAYWAKIKGEDKL